MYKLMAKWIKILKSVCHCFSRKERKKESKHKPDPAGWGLLKAGRIRVELFSCHGMSLCRATEHISITLLEEEHRNRAAKKKHEKK